MKFVPASVGKTAFNCPHCHTLTTQYWHTLRSLRSDSPLTLTEQGNMSAELVALLQKSQEDLDNISTPIFREVREYLKQTHILMGVSISECFECKKICIWIGKELQYPKTGSVQPPNPDLPPEVIKIYNEASTIFNQSPRGAAALLRLAIQMICEHLGEPGKNINTDIASLVQKGLDAQIARALDAVRVIGNEAVHPGTLDLNDNRPMAESLFRVVNFIAERTISAPKHADELFASLPETSRDAIKKRDEKNN